MENLKHKTLQQLLDLKAEIEIEIALRKASQAALNSFSAETTQDPPKGGDGTPTPPPNPIVGNGNNK